MGSWFDVRWVGFGCVGRLLLPLGGGFVGCIRYDDGLLDLINIVVVVMLTTSL